MGAGGLYDEQPGHGVGWDEGRTGSACGGVCLGGDGAGFFGSDSVTEGDGDIDPLISAAEGA